MNIQIRRATPDEADELTELAHAAKRHWNYPESWIKQWKLDLTITRDFVTDNEVYVAMIGGEIVGCCALVLRQSLAEVEHMWIKPEVMKSGVGRALFAHVKHRAANLGAQAIELSADPNAEGFYQRMGAAQIGEVRTELEGQPRVLPRMRIDLNQGA